MAHNATLAQQFDQLDGLLSTTRKYWQILPFQLLELPWQDNLALCDFLAQLDDASLERLDQDDVALRIAIANYLPVSLDILTLLSCSSGQLHDIPAWFTAGIKGRKWLQIQKFASQIPPDSSSILEWCAGKGHLGRALGFTQQREIISLEWQQILCDQGSSLAAKHGIQQQFVQADVFSPDTKSLLRREQHAIALHACGDLHTELLKQASHAHTERITLAPCCYHLIKDDYYQPLSNLAQRSSLQLSKRDLSLSMAQTVVASKREREHRAIEVAWRLGFDMLQRQLRGSDSYLPLPSIRQSMLSASFCDFCRWACAAKGLPFPGELKVARFEQLGWQRRKVNARIEIVTHAFRSLLERWLLLDRALFLGEQGYEVELSEFCKKEITPRNALITARRLD